MITAILIAIGVPLWIIAICALVVVFRDRKLRKMPGSLPVRVLPAGKKRWTKGHGVWVSDVFAWRGSPAAWKEGIDQASSASLRSASPDESKKLRRIGDDPVVASFVLADGTTLLVAAAHDDQSTLAGPFADSSKPSSLGSSETQLEPESTT